VALKQNRKHRFDAISAPWINEYKPKLHINENIYNRLLEKISPSEWDQTLRTSDNNSAPGTSLIGYSLIKNIGDDFKKTLLNFGSVIYESTRIPIEWKQTNIFPIPKPTEWN
jgi:hypothetical protein